MNYEEFIGSINVLDIQKTVNTVIFGNEYCCFKNNKEIIWKLKKYLSDYFKVHYRNIEIVGSAKLGFSLNPNKLGKLYNSDSDIDFMIVSEELFESAWKELLMLDLQYHTLRQKEREFVNDCYKTIHRGIVSPDKLPKKGVFSKKWWQIFSELSNKEDYEYRKIRGRLFKNWWFAEKYYSTIIQKETVTGEVKNEN